MRTRVIVKTIFVIILFIILMGLITIIFSKTGNSMHIYNLRLADYIIKYDNQKCLSEPELIYEDNYYKYFVPCVSSYSTYLVWDDGSNDLLKNAIRNGKVNINSLINHGLDIVKNEK